MKCAIALSLTFLLVISAVSVMADDKSKTEEKSTVVQKTTVDRANALETSVGQILRILTGQTRAIEAPVPKATKQEIRQFRTEGTAELTEKRLDAVERSLSNIASFLETKNEKPGNKCCWVRECVYIYCCQWGAPPSDPGTVKCMKQCCGAWEDRLVCD